MYMMSNVVEAGWKICTFAARLERGMALATPQVWRRVELQRDAPIALDGARRVESIEGWRIMETKLFTMLGNGLVEQKSGLVQSY